MTDNDNDVQAHSSAAGSGLLLLLSKSVAEGGGELILRSATTSTTIIHHQRHHYNHTGLPHGRIDDLLLRILHFDDLPTWMQVDPYIRHGYRRQLNSFLACFWSLFYPHNELVNTWSHLLPACFFVAFLLAADLYYYSAVGGGQRSKRKISVVDNLVVQLYTAGTAGCLFLSAFFHGANAHSHGIARHFLKLDYLGIVISISVTNLSSTYFGLYGRRRLQLLYISLSLVCAIMVFFALLNPLADGPGAASWRVAMLVALVGSGFVPIAHMALFEGFKALRNFPLIHIAIMILCFLLGTIFYVTHLPEKHWPGTFDLWVWWNLSQGASHQLFHILIALGQIVFFFGLRKAMLIHYHHHPAINLKVKSA